MKRKSIRLLAVLLVLALFIPGTGAAEAAAGSGPAVVSLRIEGMNQNLYDNSALATNLSGNFTVRDLINSCNTTPDVPKITAINEKENSRITQIGALKEKSIGSPFDDGWLIRVNGKNAGKAPDTVELTSGDDIVLYYGDASHMQYPDIDLSRLITDGIVKLTSSDEAVNDMGNTYRTNNPIAGATVTWDGMRYTTDSNGEIIIDSTGAGVRHTIQVERYDAGGLPTVLRLAPGYQVKYGFGDVAPDAWYFDAVMFVSDRKLLNGVSDADFAPDTSMNRAMFVTVIGRLTDASVNQSGPSGFSDVVSDGWSDGYIAWAVQNGIVTGCPDGTFRPYADINREQIAVLLYKYAVFKGYDTGLANADLSVYTDGSSVSDYAVAAMKWAVQNGIIQGNGNRLDPQSAATRAQAATLLQRFISKFGS